MTTSPSRGIFITFEGPDGSGKTTQSRLLRDTLTSRGWAVVHTREPGGGLGDMIRQRLLDVDRPPLAPRTEALLFAADRAEHMERVILPALTAGRVVICDRFIDSSLVYQGLIRGHGLDPIRAISDWAAGSVWPDLTVLVDADPDISVQSKHDQGEVTVWEQEPITIQHAVRDGFLRLAGSSPARPFDADPPEDRWIVVNGRAGTPDEVASHIWRHVVARVPRLAAPLTVEPATPLS